MSSKNNTSKTTPAELMRSMGSPTGQFDPEPPDQWLYELRHSKSDTGKGVAWIKSKTIAYGHNSPFAVDEHGNALNLSHMAAECGWKERTARNVLVEITHEGRGRVDELGRIWLCASVPAAHEAPKSDGQVLNSDSVQSHFSGYLLDSAKKLDPESRAKAEKRYGTFIAWRRALFADGMANLRSIADQLEDNILDQIGLEKKRLTKDPSEPKVRLEVRVVDDFDSVQSQFAAQVPDFVQTEKAGSYKEENGLYTGENADVSFIGSYSYSYSSSEAPPASPEKPTTTTSKPLPDWDIIGLVAAQYILVDDEWVRGTVRECQKHTPDITPEEIAQLIHLKGKVAQKGSNPPGLLRKAVVNACHGRAFEQLRNRLREYQEQESARKPEKRTTQQDQQERLDDLVMALQQLGEMPNSVNAPDWKQQIECARANEPDLYERAVELSRAQEGAVA